MTGLTRTDKHFYRWNDGPFVPGATGVLKQFSGDGLVNWAKRETAECALRNFDFLADMRQRGGDKAAVAWLSKLPDFKRDTAGDFGSSIHKHAEAIAHKQPVEVSEQERPYIDAYLRFRREHTLTRVRVERMVYSEKHLFGGTLDMHCTLDDKTTLLDLKTGKSLWEPDIRMQLAAYSRADFIGQPGDGRKFRIPSFERYAVLHLRPELHAAGYQLVYYDVNDADFDAFLAHLQIAQWRSSLKKERAA